jgi:hypothetical protein
MVADTRAFFYHSRPIGVSTKIFNRNGVLYGASSGSTGVASALCDWFRDHDGNVDEMPDKLSNESFTLLAVNPDGVARYFGEEWCWKAVEAPFYALGSGMEYALGALYQGASAIEAVQIACKCDIWSDHPLTVLTHKDVDKRQDV